MAYVKQAILKLLRDNPDGLSEDQIKELLSVKTKYISNTFKQLYYNNFIVKEGGLYYYNTEENGHMKNRDFLNHLKRASIR